MNLKDLGIRYFVIAEIVPAVILNQYSRARAIEFIDLRILRAWDWIRHERGNTIFMNTWGITTPDWYPTFDGRGLRINESGEFETSQHYYGRALDGDEVGVDNEELYQFCLQNQQRLLEFGVTTIENIEYAKTWVHLDCRAAKPEQKKLRIVNP